MNAHPGPMVSGKYFFPNAALLCTKRIPARTVMSRNQVFCADPSALRSTPARIEAKRKQILFICEGRIMVSHPQEELQQPYAAEPRFVSAGLPVAPRRARAPPAAHCCLPDVAAGSCP